MQLGASALAVLPQLAAQPQIGRGETRQVPSALAREPVPQALHPRRARARLRNVDDAKQARAQARAQVQA